MLDEGQSAGHAVWGVRATRGTSGSLKWPDQLKVTIIECIEAGEQIDAIARQIGANESVVSKWVEDHRDAQSRPVDGLGIVEVVGVAKSSWDSAQSYLGIACDLHPGELRLSISAGDLPFST